MLDKTYIRSKIQAYQNETCASKQNGVTIYSTIVVYIVCIQKLNERYYFLTFFVSSNIIFIYINMYVY